MVADGSQLGQPYDFLLKVIVVGESGTGKSCLLHHFIHGSVKENATQTIGVEFASRLLRVGEKDLKLQVSKISMYAVMKDVNTPFLFIISFGIPQVKNDFEV